jgi:hypothetical protein
MDPTVRFMEFTENLQTAMGQPTWRPTTPFTTGSCAKKNAGAASPSALAY